MKLACDYCGGPLETAPPACPARRTPPGATTPRRCRNYRGNPR